MGTDLRGRDLGMGFDQLPSGLYRLRVTLHGTRLTESHEDLDYLRQLKDKVLQMRKDESTKGIITRIVESWDYRP